MSNPSSASNSAAPSRTTTPNPRFTTSAKTAEDLLANQTVGLVALSDFRKRRAEALELKDRAAQDAASGNVRENERSVEQPGGQSKRGDIARRTGRSARLTHNSGDTKSGNVPKKRKKKAAGAPKLSFGDDEVDAEDATAPLVENKKQVRANAGVVAPKALTKAAQAREAAARETLRKEFLEAQERVRETVVEIPFVFYDGTDIPGGKCRVKKGDFVWLFLDRSRKVGAELGVGEKEGNRARKEWARIGVDDLMMVRGGIIIPHHYDFHYFIINRTLGPNNTRLFDYSSQPPTTSTAASPAPVDLSNYNPLARPTAKSKTPEPIDVEGRHDDPTFTKVVDRRWYEKNKHIFPASVWQDFDPEKDYQKEVKRDAGGNAFFFS